MPDPSSNDIEILGEEEIENWDLAISVWFDKILELLDQAEKLVRIK